MAREHETHLGDGLYASVEYGMIRLAAADNVVYLEYETYENLLKFVAHLRELAKATPEKGSAR